MKVKIALSANAGIALAVANVRIWVDFLHNSQVPGFSCMSSETLDLVRCGKIQAPDILCVTHIHPDHCNVKLVKEFAGQNPDTKVLAPEKITDDTVLVYGERFSYSLGDLQIQWLKLPHDGHLYRDCVHYGLLISVLDKHILIPADCAMGSDALGELVKELPVDAAFLNFPWITLKKGREFLAEVMKPKQVVVYHLPFAEDDCNRYRESAQKALVNLPYPAKLLCDPMQTMEIEI